MSSTSDKLAKLIRLPRAERRVVYLALVLLPMVGLGLRLSGLRRVRHLLDRLDGGLGRQPVEDDALLAACKATRASQLVASVARDYFYAPRCLPLALTLAWILRRQGIASDIRLGVRKTPAGIEAHAWVEQAGRLLMEAPDVYDRFAVFEQRAGSRKALRQ